MQNEDPILPIVGRDKNAPAQKPGLPKLILPPTSLRRRQTREERAMGRKPKGYAELDVGDFAARLLPYQKQLRKGAFSERQQREQKRAQQARHHLRPFFPQAGCKVERADTNANDKARGRVYLTLSNGQVIRPDKLLQMKRRGRNVLEQANPVLVQKAVQYIESKIPAQ
jgi:hypothetical protein